MPTYYKPGTRKGNRTYIVRGRIGGKQYEVATDALNKRDAESKWDGFKATVRQRQRGEPVKGAETFKDAIDAYRAYRRPNHTEVTKLDRLEAELGDRLVRDIDHMDIVRAANAIKPNVSSATRNREVYTPAAAVLHYAAELKMRDYIVIRKETEEEPATRRPAANVESVLLANTEGDKHLFILVIFEQGWRISETLGLKWDDIDMARKTFTFHIPKSGKWKTVAMSKAVYAALKAEKDKTGKVFPWPSRWAVYRWLRPLCKRLNVKFTPHMARHEFGSALNEMNATRKDIAEAGSWTSEKSVERYITVSEDRTRGFLDSRGKTRGKQKGRKASA